MHITFYSHYKKSTIYRPYHLKCNTTERFCNIQVLQRPTKVGISYLGTNPVHRCINTALSATLKAMLMTTKQYYLLPYYIAFMFHVKNESFYPLVSKEHRRQFFDYALKSSLKYI